MKHTFQHSNQTSYLATTRSATPLIRTFASHYWTFNNKRVFMFFIGQTQMFTSQEGFHSKNYYLLFHLARYFFLLGKKTEVGKKVQYLDFQLKYDFKCVAFQVLEMTFPTSFSSQYAPFCSVIVILRGFSPFGARFPLT